MRLYNSLTRQKQTLTPLTPGEIGMYLCGPTVYDRAHIGNARPSAVFDTLCRLLSLTHKVTYVRNITDVDDKIIEAAHKNKETIETLTHRTTEQYQQDMGLLNISPPTVEPRATDHIKEMIHIIQILLDKGHAYEAESHVLFETTTDPNYGTLSNRNLEDMIAGARVEVAPYKKNPTDFVLWKPSQEGDPGWESPWGRGRPGWHIECSAMGQKYLGLTFDIHGGGQDLMFPHHENEKAQSTCAHGKDTFAQIWMHNGMLMVEGKKMSKSWGNFFTVHDLLGTLPGEVIRLTLLSSHYRQPLDWTRALVQQCKITLDRFYTSLKDLPLENTTPPHEKIMEALEDDLNTPLALSIMAALVKDIHSTSDLNHKIQLASSLRASGQMLGILFQDPETWFKNKLPSLPETSTLTEDQIKSFIQQRLQARLSKKYDEADRIRKKLEDFGILLEDTSERTTWKRK